MSTNLDRLRLVAMNPRPNLAEGQGVILNHRLQRRAHVFLNVYNLTAANKVLSRVGVGIFHSAVEVYGIGPPPLLLTGGSFVRVRVRGPRVC
jgi:hypothetical protein